MIKNIIFYSAIFFAFLFSKNFAQENISIHKLEAQKHRVERLSKENGNNSVRSIIPLNKSVNKNLSHYVFGYYPYWEKSNGADKNFNYDCLTHIAIFDFSVTSTGSLVPPSGWNNGDWDSFMNEAHSNGVKLIPVITNFSLSDSEMDGVFNNTFYRWAFMLAVQNLVEENNLDGVNIDFEGLASQYRGSVINNFLQEVSDSIHSINPEMEVSFASPAVNWGGWDFYGLANSCDYLFVMGYDFYGSWSSTTGPTAPLISSSNYNVTKTINSQYATVSTFQPEKLILGVPYYGPHWIATSASEGATTKSYVQAERYYSYIDQAETYGINWSTTFKNPWLSYTNGSDIHQIWFDNDSSLALKYDFAISKNLKGIGMWALGYDGARTELWNLILDKFSIPVSVDKEVIMNKFELSQNYPNPFNPSTTIKYTIPSSSVILSEGKNVKDFSSQVSQYNKVNVVLKIFDVLGKQVSTLVNEEQNPGTYTINFNASNLTSGIYYYQLSFGEYNQTKKMMLIK